MKHRKGWAAGLLLGTTLAHGAGTLSLCVNAAPEGFDMAQYETTGTFDGVGVPL